MKKKIVFKTNVMICGVAAVAFLLATALSGYAGFMAAKVDSGQAADVLEMHGLAVAAGLLPVVLAVTLTVLIHTVYSYNRQVITLAQNWAREHQTLFEKATKELYDDIYELNVTRDRPANRATEDYFESLGVPNGAPFSAALALVAEKQIKKEFRQGYLDTFLPENVLRAYEKGREMLSYEFMISQDGEHYYWMRITTRIVRWESDGSLHMLTYRQNIDAEKRREREIQKLAQTDEMTGLLTKTATERRISQMLREDQVCFYAFFVLDIDDFKQVNDQYGHAFGDEIIRNFTQTLSRQFRKNDIIGRIGGDEFVVFVQAPDQDWARAKARQLVTALNKPCLSGGRSWHISASLGVAFSSARGNDYTNFYKTAERALYATKERGKNSFTFYE